VGAVANGGAADYQSIGRFRQLLDRRRTRARGPADAYREVPHFFKELDLHGDVEGWGYLAFFYPPFFLLLCAGVALLNYLPALILWLTATCAGYAAALRAMLPQDLRQQGVRLWVLFLGYPAVLVNAGFGQNGSAGLLGGAAVRLERRPELAGFCLGCLAYNRSSGLSYRSRRSRAGGDVSRRQP
jgi:hypothetical protein